jgi:hypothetical protein
MSWSVDAKEGRGCSHCEDGTPMSWFSSGRGTIALCMTCLLDWFPGRTAAWLEERLDYYIDHIDYGLAVAEAREENRHREALKLEPKSLPRKPDWQAAIPKNQRPR